MMNKSATTTRNSREVFRGQKYIPIFGVLWRGSSFFRSYRLLIRVAVWRVFFLVCWGRHAH